MRLIVAIVQDKDASVLLGALTEAGFRATRLASTGGFLRGGNTTLLIGTDNDMVRDVLGIVQRICKSREEKLASHSPAAATGEPFVPFDTKVTVGGATVFVLDVVHFQRW